MNNIEIKSIQQDIEKQAKENIRIKTEIANNMPDTPLDKLVKKNHNKQIQNQKTKFAKGNNRSSTALRAQCA